jgi:uncharacterized membrane protein
MVMALPLCKGKSNDTIDNLASQNKKMSIKERKWQILTPINEAVVIVQVDLMQRANSIVGFKSVAIFCSFRLFSVLHFMEWNSHFAL